MRLLRYPAKMTLLYTIERALSGKREKFLESYFGWIKFATEREHIAALEASLRGNRNILRYLLIQTVREDAAPRRAVFTSDRLEGETIQKPTTEPETPTKRGIFSKFKREELPTSSREPQSPIEISRRIRPGQRRR